MVTYTVIIGCHQAHISECRLNIGATNVISTTIFRSTQSGSKAIYIFPEQLPKRHNIKTHTHKNYRFTLGYDGHGLACMLYG